MGIGSTKIKPKWSGKGVLRQGQQGWVLEGAEPGLKGTVHI